MNKILPLLVFSILLLVPVGAQNAFAGFLPSVDLVITVNPTSFEPGDTVTFTYTVTNDGEESLFCGPVTDDKLGIVSGSDIGILNPGEQIQFVLTADIFTTTKHTAVVVCLVEISGDTIVQDMDMVTVFASDFIGGESLSVDSSALILAGAQSFSWMIPVVLSVLGIGLFTVSRKSENS